jgi:hypothetical protein
MRLVPVVVAAQLLLASAAGAVSDVVATSEQRTGETPEDAVVIDAGNSAEGVPLEYAWIRHNLPGSRIERQALVNIDGKIYDRFDVVLSSGEARSFYFNVTKYFGRRP